MAPEELEQIKRQMLAMGDEFGEVKAQMGDLMATVRVRIEQEKETRKQDEKLLDSKLDGVVQRLGGSIGKVEAAFAAHDTWQAESDREMRRLIEDVRDAGSKGRKALHDKIEKGLDSVHGRITNHLHEDHGDGAAAAAHGQQKVEQTVQTGGGNTNTLTVALMSAGASAGGLGLIGWVLYALGILKI